MLRWCFVPPLSSGLGAAKMESQIINLDWYVQVDKSLQLIFISSVFFIKSKKK